MGKFAALDKEAAYMAYIHVDQLDKTYRISRRGKGALGAIKGLLHPSYTRVEALSKVSFDIEAGEVVGYIGPNGAGKSTTVKILSGILVPDGGTALVDGRIPWRQRRAHVSHIGVVFGQRTQLWWDVPVIDSYELLRDIYGVPQADFRRRLEEMTEALDLAAVLHTPLRQLSLGQRMRCELAASLLHSPQLLFLDEPTIGLDAVSKLAVRDFLARERQRHGTTIMLTTHDMEDITSLCSRVMVLGHGKKLYDGALDPLLARYNTLRTLTVEYEGEARLEIPEVESCCKEGLTYRVVFQPERVETARVLELAQRAGHVHDLSVQGMPLDEMVAALYKEMAL